MPIKTYIPFKFVVEFLFERLSLVGILFSHGLPWANIGSWFLSVFMSSFKTFHWRGSLFMLRYPNWVLRDIIVIFYDEGRLFNMILIYIASVMRLFMMGLFRVDKSLAITSILFTWTLMLPNSFIFKAEYCYNNTCMLVAIFTSYIILMISNISLVVL